MNETFPSVKVASGLENLIDIANDASNSWERIWYRGVKDSRFDLQPTVLRNKNLMERERNRCKALRRHASSIYPSIASDNYQRWLFIGQHFGLPTRLLDWTESLLVALYFALDGRKDTAPAIWMLDPVHLNRICLNDKQAYVANVQNAATQNYCRYAFSTHKDDKRLVGELPLAVYPEYVDQRLIAQQSCFTIHGTNTTSLNEQYTKSIPKSHSDFLIKIVFDKDVEERITHQFRAISPKASTIFPGMDGIIKDLLVDT